MFNLKLKTMRNFTKIVTSTFVLFIIALSAAFAQVPADQEVIVVEPGSGTLEKTINGDTIAGGNRINPNRIYQLKKDGVYVMESPILFGGENTDESATLIIIGEKGGKKPIVVMSPKDGGNAFTNLVHGSLTVKNVYWPSQAINNTGAVLFRLFRSNQTLRLEDFVTEFATNGDLFDLRPTTGPTSVFIKNSYFRDNTHFKNSWNFAVFARGDNGEPFDSIWIENTTVTNSGLTFFGKLNPIKFMFFDHNTIVNTPKYVFFFDQYLEAYFTNNMFINCNWQGECMATYLSQLPDGVPNGVTNLDTIDANLWTLGHGYVPAMEDVKWLSANNLHFTSPYLDKYYAGDYNTVANYPLSNRDWGFLPPGTSLPTQVENVPPAFITAKTQTLIDNYAGVKAINNYDNTKDPLMKTKGIASQAVGDEYAKKARNDYGVANAGETYDASVMYFGDNNPMTIPGIETEDGGGFNEITDFIEDFSYDADIKSEIDGRHLGSLSWYPSELAGYDGKAALAQIKTFYSETATNEISKASNFSIYPNPAQNSLNISSELPMESATIFDITGRMLNLINLNGVRQKTIDVSNLENGFFILRVKSISGEYSSSKFCKE